MDTRHKRSAALFGAGLVVLGLILLADVIGIIDSEPLLRQYWPVLSFFVGFVLLNQAENVMLGLTIMLVSVLLMLGRLGVLGGQSGDIVISFTILGIGVLLLVWMGDRFAGGTGQGRPPR